MTRILIALDESEESLRAARVATALFGFKDTEFLVINVTRLPVPWVAGGIYGEVWAADPLLWGEQSAELEEEERAELQAEAHDVGIDDAEILVEMGDPADAICKAADEHDVDVVVVGSHDKGFLRRLWDPSVADRVVHHTDKPVLVVSSAHHKGGAS